MRVAFVGKGGSGKTTMAAAFSRHLAARGHPVLVFDADINQHLAQALGHPRRGLASLVMRRVEQPFAPASPHAPSRPGGAHLSGCAMRLRWEKSRLSQHLGRMQSRGLVTRERCLTDQRGAVIIITPRGSELIKAAAPQHVADVRDVLIDHLTATELATLATIGDKVRERLAALGRQAQPERSEYR